jgi:polar amino acid transport system permease protein
MTSTLDSLASIADPLAHGAITALQVGAGAFVLALALGFTMACAVTFLRNRPLSMAIAAYIEWMRNVPALAHLFVLYFGLPAFGIRLSPVVAAMLGLGLVGAAVLCDVFAAGLKAIHVGQREAALSVGLTPRQALRYVLMPQVLRLTLPSLGNYVSQLIKDTSIASAIAAPEIMFYARNLVTSTFQTTLIYVTAMVMYAVMLLPVSWMFSRLERRMEAAR